MYLLYGLLTFIVIFILFRKSIRKYTKGGQCNINKNLSGKVAIVTGSNTGIGYETAKKLAECQATIIVACRNEQRGKSAQERLQKETGNKNIFYLNLNLSSLKNIEEFSQNFKKQFDRLDLLVNNAGIMFTIQRELTEDGFESQVGVNHLGHFHLTNQLMDILEKTSETYKDVRVVNVSSIAYMQNFGKIDWTNYMGQKSYDMKTQYANSKLSNIYHAKYLSLNKKSDNITFMSLHPGVVDTELFRNVNEYKIVGLAHKYLKPVWGYFVKTAKDGAQTSLYCCLMDQKDIKCGGYYTDCKLKSLYKFAEDVDEINKLWKYSTTLVNGSLQKRK